MKGQLLAVYQRFVDLLTQYWAGIVTIGVAVIAALFWSRAEDSEQLEALGGYISGIVGAITLLWLAIGQRYQLEELKLQRQELGLQRLAAEQQAKELHDSARIGIMSQVRSLLDDAREIIAQSSLAKSESDLTPLLYKGMLGWADIEKSRDPEVVVAAYGEWQKVEVLCKQYLARVASAMMLYQEFNVPSSPLPRDESPAEIVYNYQSWVRNAPFLDSSIAPASFLAQHVMMVEPGMKRMLLASMVAHAKVLGWLAFKDNYLETLRDEVLRKSKTLPAICTPWPKYKSVPS